MQTPFKNTAHRANYGIANASHLKTLHEEPTPELQTED